MSYQTPAAANLSKAPTTGQPPAMSSVCTAQPAAVAPNNNVQQQHEADANLNALCNDLTYSFIDIPMLTQSDNEGGDDDDPMT
jgi:hypothetical protein